MACKSFLKKYFFDFFNKGHQRSIEAKKNIAASFLIKGISILISLVLVPLTIDYINPTQYGIWLTLSSIVAWFSFFDMGFGNGMRNRFAEAKANGDMLKARVYVSTTYAVLGLIFGVVWAVFFVVNFFIDWSIILNAPSNMAEELSILALIIVSFFCLQIVLKTITTVLYADQKPAKASFFDMLGQLLALLIIFVLTRTTKGSLVYLGLALGIAPVALLFTSSFFFFKGEYKQVEPACRFVKFAHARDIMGLGLKFFVIQFSAIVIFQTSNVVIAQTLGPDFVTVYNIVFKYFSVLSLSFMIILIPFWSAFTDAYAKNDTLWMQNTIKNLKKLWLILLPLTLIMILSSQILFRIWVGDQIKIPISITALMGLYFLLFTRFNLFILLINGIGKVKLQLIINVFICILFIPIALYACSNFGLKGLISANIVVSFIHAVISEVQIGKIMNSTAKGIWFK